MVNVLHIKSVCKHGLVCFAMEVFCPCTSCFCASVSYSFSVTENRSGTSAHGICITKLPCHILKKYCYCYSVYEHD